MKTQIDKDFINGLLADARVNECLQTTNNRHTSSADNAQQVFHAFLPNAKFNIHKHIGSSENVICLFGIIDVVFFKESREFVHSNISDFSMDAQDVMSRKVLKEVERLHLSPDEGNFGCVVPADTWHSFNVIEPCVIYESNGGSNINTTSF